MARTVGSDVKDKDEKVTYTVNWAPALNGATLSTVTWDTSGLTTESTGNTTTVASIRLSGGTPGQVYMVTCSIVASSGAELQVQFPITVDN